VDQVRHQVIDGMVDASVTPGSLSLMSAGNSMWEAGCREGRSIKNPLSEPAFGEPSLIRSFLLERGAVASTDRLPGFSAMARYGQLEPGALLHNVKPHSYLYHVSVGFGPYGTGDGPPHWEIEHALASDLGIFVNDIGQSRKEFFNSLALTYGVFRVESWNDNVHHKDKGPTYGMTVTLHLFRLFKKKREENKSS